LRNANPASKRPKAGPIRGSTARGLQRAVQQARMQQTWDPGEVGAKRFRARFVGIATAARPTQPAHDAPLIEASD